MRRIAVFLAALLLLAAPAAAQTPAQLDSMRVELVRCIAFGKGADTQATKALNELAAGDTAAARVEMVRSRGMVRALITQCDKSLVILDRSRGAAPPDTIVVPPDTVIPDPPVEPDPEPEPEPEPPVWATGRWALRANGQPLALDFDAARLELPMGMGVVTISTSLSADTARLTFQVPVYGAGVMRLVHTAGTVAGTMTVAGQSAQVTGERVVVPRPIIDLDTVAPAPRIGLRYDSVRVVVPGATVDARGSLVLAPGESVTVCAVGWSDGQLYLMPGEDVEAHSFGDDHIVTIEFGPGFPTECMRRGSGPSPFSTFLAIRVE